MKEIFKKIKGIEWDWFGYDMSVYSWEIGNNKISFWDENAPDYGSSLGQPTVDYSLADLLANQSWCKAVWNKKIKKCSNCGGISTSYGYKKFYNCDCIDNNIINDWEYSSEQAFLTLRDKGKEEAIQYIEATMN